MIRCLFVRLSASKITYCVISVEDDLFLGYQHRRWLFVGLSASNMICVWVNSVEDYFLLDYQRRRWFVFGLSASKMIKLWERRVRSGSDFQGTMAISANSITKMYLPSRPRVGDLLARSCGAAPTVRVSRSPDHDCNVRQWVSELGNIPDHLTLVTSQANMWSDAGWL